MLHCCAAAMLAHLLLQSRRRVCSASRSDLDAAVALSRLVSRHSRWQHASAVEEPQAAASEAGPLALYEAGVSGGKYRSDPRQARQRPASAALWPDTRVLR